MNNKNPRLYLSDPRGHAQLLAALAPAAEPAAEPTPEPAAEPELAPAAEPEPAPAPAEPAAPQKKRLKKTAA
jgi:hypothetical protein